MSVFDLVKKGEHDEVFKILNETNVGDILYNGHTLLLLCCAYNFTDYAIELIDLFGDLTRPEIRGNDGNTALIYAISKSNEILANKLLDMDRTWLTINEYNEFAVCPLSGSVQKFLKSVFDRLILRADVNATNIYGRNVLSLVISLYIRNKNYPGLEYYIEKLIDDGANVDQKDINGESPLLLCSLLPAHIVDKILEIKRINCNETGFKRFNITDFSNLRKIGLQKGGYGQVFPAIEKSSGNVKILKKILIFDSLSTISDDIIKEIVYINIINDKHECNIAVNLEGFCTNENNFYLVLQPLDMKLNEYFNIINKLQNRETYILKMVENLIKTVYAINSLGICHNDLKSENLMVHNSQIYAIDFGISNLLLVSPSTKLEYDATVFIKAPDGEEITFNGISMNNNYSYHSDVFSIGCTLLNIILDTYSRYIYIEETNILYRNKINPGWKLTNILIPLTKEELDKINNCGDYMYDLIIGMVNFNANKRIKLGDLLNEPKNKFEGSITEYSYVELNSIYNQLIKNNKIYSALDIRENNNELEYLEEISINYRDRMINLEKDSNINNMKYITNHILKVMESSSLSFDDLVNTLILLRQHVDQNLSEQNFKNHYLECLHFCGNVNSVEYIKPKMVSPFYKTKFVANFNTLILNNTKYEPIYVHIQYIIIQMRLMNISFETICKFEWYAMEMIIELVQTIKNSKVSFWNFLIECTVKFCTDNFLEIPSFISSEHTNEYKLN